MIDLAWCGGLGEARRIADMAAAWRVPVTLHDCTGPVVFAASCALSATLPHANWQEMVRAYVHGWYREIVTALPQVTNGSVSPLDERGARAEFAPRDPVSPRRDGRGEFGLSRRDLSLRGGSTTYDAANERDDVGRGLAVSSIMAAGLCEY